MDNELHTRFKALLVRNLWDVDLESLPWPRAVLIRTARILYVVGRDLLDGLPTLRAMSLVYTTLLALVPLLAVSFSVLKAFGVHNQIEPLLLQFLAPLGEKGTEVASRIVHFVENVRVGVLPEGAVVEQLMQRMDEAVAGALQDCTLRDLVLSVDQG